MKFFKTTTIKNRDFKYHFKIVAAIGNFSAWYLPFNICKAIRKQI